MREIELLPTLLSLMQHRVMLFALLLTPVTALAQTPGEAPRNAQPKQQQDGAALARAIEATDDEEARAPLMDAVAQLSPAEKSTFLAWADARFKSHGWKHLAHAVGNLGTPEATNALIRVARTLLDRDDVAAEEVLDALSGTTPDASFERLWATWRMPNYRQSFTPVVAGVVATDPAQGLRRFMDQVESVWRDQERLPEDRRMPVDERRAFDEQVSRVLGDALAATDRPDLFLATINPATAPLPVASAVVNGISQRVPSLTALLQAQVGVARASAATRLGPADPDADLDPEEAAERAEALQEAIEEELADADPIAHSDDMNAERLLFDGALRSLTQREDDNVLALVFDVLPRVVDRLDEDWAELLIAALEHPQESPNHRVVRDAAFRALLTMTGQKLNQTKAAWSQWWSKRTREDQ